MEILLIIIALGVAYGFGRRHGARSVRARYREIFKD